MSPDPVSASRPVGGPILPPTVLSLLIALVCWIPAEGASAQLAVALRTVAGPGTQVSGGATLISIPVDPCNELGAVVFGGSTDAGVQGLFLAVPPNPVTPVVDTTTPVPDGFGLFSDLSRPPSLSDGALALFAETSSGRRGVYACPAQPVDPCRMLADTATQIPEGSGAFTDFPAGPSIDGRVVAFLGEGTEGQQGVYACDRSIPTEPCRKLADTTTEIPDGAGTFTSFVPNVVGAEPPPPVVSGALVAFYGAGAGGQEGLYVCDRAIPTEPCRKLADTLTGIPIGGGGVGTFSAFARVSLDEVGNVAFLGAGTVTFGGGDTDLTSYVQGVYRALSSGAVPWSEIARVADVFTPIPGGSGVFMGFGAVSIDPGVVTFVGLGDGGQKGLYTDFAGPLSKVLAVGDPLGSHRVTDLSMGPFGFHDGEVVFRVSLDDGSEAVMAATLGAYRCPRTHGYYRSHPASWPLGALTLGGQDYSQAELLALLGGSGGSDTSVILARQLIAAELNVAAGSDPSPASAAIDAAQLLLNGLVGRLPLSVRPSSVVGGQMTSLAASLESYNSGASTPFCIPPEG